MKNMAYTPLESSTNGIPTYTSYKLCIALVSAKSILVNLKASCIITRNMPDSVGQDSFVSQG